MSLQSSPWSVGHVTPILGICQSSAPFTMQGFSIVPFSEQGHPTSKNKKNALNAVYCFLISFYGLLKGYLCELTLFYLFGCGS